MPEQKVVPIGRVVPCAPPSPLVKRMIRVLEKQGQIEPLQVREVNGNLKTFAQDAWADEIVYAANQLEWPTLLVLVTDNYIR